MNSQLKLELLQQLSNTYCRRMFIKDEQYTKLAGEIMNLCKEYERVKEDIIKVEDLVYKDQKKKMLEELLLTHTHKNN